MKMEDEVTKRNFVKAVGAGAAGLGGLYLVNIADFLGLGDRNSSDRVPETQEVVEASIDDIERVGNYLDQEVIGNQMLEDEWNDLLEVYEDGEFFPGEDIQLQRLDIVYDERTGEDSKYRISSALSGMEDGQLSDWYEFEHDETAEKALQYFGEL